MWLSEVFVVLGAGEVAGSTDDSGQSNIGMEARQQRVRRGIITVCIMRSIVGIRNCWQRSAVVAAAASGPQGPTEELSANYCYGGTSGAQASAIGHRQVETA